MDLFLLALVVAALFCGGVLWRRPDARAAASGAWQAGSAQAVAEFRQGYSFAQERLRAGEPSWYNPRRWASWLLSGAYGTAKTIGASNRIRREAWQGGQAQYRAWKAAQPVDAEVIEESTSVIRCPDCGAGNVRWWDRLDPPAWYCPTCGDRRYQAQQAQPKTEEGPTEQTVPDDPPEDPPDDDPKPQHDNTEEGPKMQNEATGLTTYAAAHTGLAGELRERMSGSESLAASMSAVLAQHSDLIGKTAVLQDILNQAAGIADEIAALSLAVANN